MTAEFNPVGGLIHLYHVWSIFGAITSVIFGMRAYKRWRVHGGTWVNAPKEWLALIRAFSFNTCRDCLSFFKWVFFGFAGVPYQWPNRRQEVWNYSADQTLLLGITLGGAGRFLTAAYWAYAHVETNYGPMVYIPALTVLVAIAGDTNHHITAWSHKPHRYRLTILASVLWVLVGFFFYNTMTM